jgi:hypothetical protein
LKVLNKQKIETGNRTAGKKKQESRVKTSKTKVKKYSK